MVATLIEREIDPLADGLHRQGDDVDRGSGEAAGQQEADRQEKERAHKCRD